MTEKPKLKPASENPWYVLMTVAGEQTGNRIDWGLHARNRRFWNGWAAGALTEREKSALSAKMRATAEDLAPLTATESFIIMSALNDRCGSVELPEPAGRVDLSEVEFANPIICSCFLFFGHTDFRGATFNGTAYFGGATFSGHANFRRSTFFRYADFYGAAFSGYAGFEHATFSGYAAFTGATFSGYTGYVDCHFESRAVFTRSRFVPPEFFNAQLHEDTDWTDVEWPGPPRNRDQAIQHRRAYERLKLVMDGQKKFHDEHMFLRMELRCREIEEPNSWASWASRLFRWFSDYGWSIQRPAAGLAGLLGLGWMLIFLAEWWDRWLGGGDGLGLGQSFAISLSNVFGFLGFARTFLKEEMETLTPFSEIVSAGQTILGLILFFLLGLALRNRFRMK